MAPEAVSETLPPGAMVADEGVTVIVGEAFTVAVPVNITLSATPVAEKVSEPEAPLVALDLSRTYTVVEFTVPETGEIETEPA